ncbi:fatty acid-binding protein 2-like [Battus philenor]|uniref:fatty acid-binding protein 2-like n=1 Tax=Battus philenor TaxID=42288 RepID=UPI0035D111E1
MAYFGKVFTVESEENFEDFIKSMGIPEEKTKNIREYKPKQKVEKDGDNYIFTVYANSGEKVYKCKSGEEFDNTFRDLPVKITITADGNKFTQVIKFEIGLTITIKKEYSDDRLVEEITHNLWDGVARKTYKVE